jgi:hypothetical protein
MSELTPEQRGIDAAPAQTGDTYVSEPVAPVKSNAWKKHLVAIVDRCTAVFLYSFLGLVTATNMSDPTALKAAGIAGGLSVAAYLRGVAGVYVASTPEVS